MGKSVRISGNVSSPESMIQSLGIPLARQRRLTAMVVESAKRLNIPINLDVLAKLTSSKKSSGIVVSRKRVNTPASPGNGPAESRKQREIVSASR